MDHTASGNLLHTFILFVGPAAPLVMVVIGVVVALRRRRKR
jgi:hypothetical protein